MIKGTEKKKFKYVYGPVYSWRLGMSLGIDPVSAEKKICNFDCHYCQLGRTTRFESERREFVPTQAILYEANAFPSLGIDMCSAPQTAPPLAGWTKGASQYHPEPIRLRSGRSAEQSRSTGDAPAFRPEMRRIDYLTFSGRGEPTLAKNLGDMILSLRKVRKEKIAVITNSSLLWRKDVQEDLSLADFVMAKLDACSQQSFEHINHPAAGITLGKIVEGITTFTEKYLGKFALQIMFVEESKRFVSDIVRLVRQIKLDEVQLNTPLRPSGGKPISQEEMSRIKVYFAGLPVLSVYDVEPKDIEPYDELQTIKRHGRYRRISKHLTNLEIT